MTRFARLLTVALLLLPVAAVGADRPPDQSTRITRVGQAAMSAQHIPGMVIAVAKDGHIMYLRGFGTRGGGHPVTGDTVFPIGSITKQFTAACVMRLVEAGKIRLDATVSTYLPNVPHAGEITVRQLLNQTTGLIDYSQQPQMMRDIGPSRLQYLSSSKALSYIAAKPLQFKPGTKFDYSNTNFLIADLIVERVSGQTFDTFLASNIFKPLGMTNTQYLKTSIPVGTNVSRGFSAAKDPPQMLPAFTMSWAGGAGQMASNAPDLVRWDNAFFHGRVLSLRDVRIATTPPTLHPASQYAFGWVVENVHGQRMIWHNGDVPGAHGMNAVFPQSGYAVIVLTNVISAKPEDIARSVWAILSR